MFKLDGRDGKIHYAHEKMFRYHFPMCCEDTSDFENANLKLAFDYKEVTCEKCLKRYESLK